MTDEIEKELRELIWYELGDGLNATDVNEAVQAIQAIINRSVAEARLNELKHRADDTIGRMYRLDREYAKSYVATLTEEGEKQ